eukprot:CAMPEP_0184487444 /NCGR_PEP_ID=MMETSP0113_2-20130426/10115_1 /TAXON_ID=91329 /ORGANISM="Norrisiella sphaerica, Strain BC52" /LENGTH=206 /DNA_ID=CAMNT_0026869765 /DNA_START=39 /DNA_END=657 /DNA_ORIENTATION=+
MIRFIFSSSGRCLRKLVCQSQSQRFMKLSTRLQLPHEILGVGPNAEKDEIKRAYRDLAKRWHPDVNNAEDAPVRFAKMTKAYQYMISPEKGWDGDAQADGVREPPPPPGEQTQSGPDWGGYHWAAEFYGLGEESNFDEPSTHSNMKNPAEAGQVAVNNSSMIRGSMGRLSSQTEPSMLSNLLKIHRVAKILYEIEAERSVRKRQHM